MTIDENSIFIATIENSTSEVEAIVRPAGNGRYTVMSEYIPVYIVAVLHEKLKRPAFSRCSISALFTGKNIKDGKRSWCSVNVSSIKPLTKELAEKYIVDLI